MSGFADRVTFMYVCKSLCNIYVCTCVCVSVHACGYISMYIPTCVCMYVCTFMHVHMLEVSDCYILRHHDSRIMTSRL